MVARLKLKALKSKQRDNDKIVILLNIILSYILGIGIFLVSLPLIPQFTYYGEKSGVFQSPSKLGEKKLQNNFINTIPLVNTLIIPKIGIDTEIIEGSNEQTLNQGIWRKPYTSNPEKGGNMVLTGHRYLFTSGSHTFYHLDKLVIDDVIKVFWDSKLYSYKVTEVKIVTPNETWIEGQNLGDRITLYTCTPLWTSEKRLVVIGKKFD